MTEAALQGPDTWNIQILEANIPHEIYKQRSIQGQENTNQRVETYSVYGGCELISRARPKSAILIVSFVTNKFSAKKFVGISCKLQQTKLAAKEKYANTKRNKVHGLRKKFKRILI